MTVGHMFVGGGEAPEPKKVKGGLLGADYSLENGRYRVAKVYDGENWNPGNEAPLTQPGVNVKAGDYLLAVNGRDLHATDNIYSFFEETAGKQVVLKVGANPDGKDSRDVTVVPVDSEENLRHLAWIENNRRRVDEATGGRIAYVHVPNTAGGGYTSFNRYFFSQVGKEAAIIDERFNEGGQLADYIIDYLRRPMMSKVVTREGHDWSSPSEAIYGPKVMIINEMSGSGGDALPWYFRKAGIGPLDRQKNLGRTGRHRRLSRTHRRRPRHRAARRHLRPQRRLGSRKPRRCPRRRSRSRASRVASKAATRSWRKRSRW